MPKIITLTCGYCEESFQKSIYPSSKIPSYCCPQCGYKARTGKRTKKHTPAHQEIIKNYAAEGARAISSRLGIPVFAVQNIAYSYGITLNLDKYKTLVHGAASDHMTKHNPMHNETSKTKAMKSAKKNPKRTEHMQKFREGHRKLAKNKPSKPELLVCKILDSLNISFDHQFAIKDKLVVDFRIGNLILQVDGEYWHGHPKFYPLTKRQLAQRKRDRSHDAYCRACGYVVQRIWAQEISRESILTVLAK